jgi:amidase
MATDLAFLPATELARMIQDREISSAEVLETYIARTERYDGAINAVVVRRFDEARERAAAADAALAAGESWGALHGVPMTIKESFDWVGTPTTKGLPALADNYPDTNAEVVDRLLDTGAVIFGKTNVPALLADWQSFNDVYGTTTNPWDPALVPGGSSGGSAAALAAGMTGLELGGDIAGSIRNPAHYCGVYGHKPSFGIVPNAGRLQPGLFAMNDMTVAGPLARSATDLEVVLDALTGPSRLDRPGWRLELPPGANRSPSDWRVAVMLDSPSCAQDDELTEHLQGVVESLAELGVTVDVRARPDIDMARAHHVFLLLLRAATGVHVSDEDFVRHERGVAAWDDGSRLYRAYADRGTTLTHRDWFEIHDERQRMRVAWADFFESYDLLLCPNAASTAFPHDHEGERPDRFILVNGRPEPAPDQLFWAGLANAFYLPGTAAPTGVTASGLPCGIQILAPYLGDRSSIAFARMMETELGGFEPPPGYD